MSFQVDEIKNILKEYIRNYKKSLDISQWGQVVSVGDGVCRALWFAKCHDGGDCLF